LCCSNNESQMQVLYFPSAFHSFICILSRLRAKIWFCKNLHVSIYCNYVLWNRISRTLWSVFSIFFPHSLNPYERHIQDDSYNLKKTTKPLLKKIFKAGAGPEQPDLAVHVPVNCKGVGLHDLYRSLPAY